MTKINLNKIEISKLLSSKKGFSILLSKKLINDLINIMIELIEINKLSLKNIGNFKLIPKKPRLGRNPKTKEEFIISKRKAISFIASKRLVKNINS